MEKRYYLHREERYGIIGDVRAALAHDNAPDHRVDEYVAVTQGEYDDCVLDLRYEDGEWTQ